jgi:hypothetical protein
VLREKIVRGKPERLSFATGEMHRITSRYAASDQWNQ